MICPSLGLFPTTSPPTRAPFPSLMPFSCSAAHSGEASDLGFWVPLGILEIWRLGRRSYARGILQESQPKSCQRGLQELASSTSDISRVVKLTMA